MFKLPYIYSIHTLNDKWTKHHIGRTIRSKNGTEREKKRGK